MDRYVYRGALVVEGFFGALAVVAGIGEWTRVFMIAVGLAVLTLPLLVHSQTRLHLAAIRRRSGGSKGAVSSSDEAKLDRLIRTTNELASAYEVQLRSANEIRRESRALRAQLTYGTRPSSTDKNNA